jgi:hypothetical protein
MDYKFNLTGLKSIYNEYINRKLQTLVFEIKHGKGLFNFLMFFSDEDKESKDRLYLFLGRTSVFIKLKLYGSHRNGDFTIYIKERQKELIIDELDLAKHDGTFDFTKFLEDLNGTIPSELSKVKLIKREVWIQVKNEIPNIIDESEKTILSGIMKLSHGKKPREKTLRKLYYFVCDSATTFADLIHDLKSKNTTLAWTNDEGKRGKSIVEIYIQLNSNTE